MADLVGKGEAGKVFFQPVAVEKRPESVGGGDNGIGHDAQLIAPRKLIQRIPDPVDGIGRQGLYDLELEAFLRVLKGEQEPDRSLDHELLVQETLLRGTGQIEG